MPVRIRTLARAVAAISVASLFALRATAHDRITTAVTWDREVSPIIQARCAECHRAGGRSTIALATYRQARPWAAAIKEEVLTRRMPKWNAARGYGDFANDPSLSPFEIALVAAWVDGGAPETDGTPAAAPAAGAAPPITGLQSHARMRVVSLSCQDQAIAGRMLAVSPRLDRGAWSGIAARLPDGRQEIIAWIRDYDPDYPTTYWLRRPLLLPAGSRLMVESRGPCEIDVTFAR